MLQLDTSRSKIEEYKNEQLLRRSRNIVALLNHTIPGNLDLTAGLRLLGQVETDQGAQRTALAYGMTQYTRSGFDQALLDAPVVPLGGTFIGQALREAGEDIAGLSGRTAIILVSDGRSPDDDPIPAVESLRSSFGDRVCVSTIHVGANRAGQQLLEDITSRSGCGIAVEGDQVSSAAGMADFVERIFLAEPKPAEPEPAPKPKAPADSDQDGYADPRDTCPDSPTQARVDDSGCWTIDNVLFDFDKSAVKPAFHDALKDVARVMRQNPGLTVRLHGHTDSIGTESYNKGLSMNRAKAVKRFITGQGVAADRIQTRAHGESDPVASNDSGRGRQKNRRVVIEPSRR